MMNASCLLVGGGLGWLIDSRLGTIPAFILIGAATGIVTGGLATYREVRKYLND